MLENITPVEVMIGVMIMLFITIIILVIGIIITQNKDFKEILKNIAVFTNPVVYVFGIITMICVMAYGAVKGMFVTSIEFIKSIFD